jgi:Rieske Fe-S protein
VTDGQIICPCHGSVFDAETGEVLGGPAPSPLEPVEVVVEGQDVVVG